MALTGNFFFPIFILFNLFIISHPFSALQMPNTKDKTDQDERNCRTDGMVLHHSESLFQFAGDKENVPENHPFGDGYFLFYFILLSLLLIPSSFFSHPFLLSLSDFQNNNDYDSDGGQGDFGGDFGADESVFPPDMTLNPAPLDVSPAYELETVKIDFARVCFCFRFCLYFICFLFSYPLSQTPKQVDIKGLKSSIWKTIDKPEEEEEEEEEEQTFQVCSSPPHFFPLFFNLTFPPLFSLPPDDVKRPP